MTLLPACCISETVSSGHDICSALGSIGSSRHHCRSKWGELEFHFCISLYAVSASSRELPLHLRLANIIILVWLLSK